MRSRAELRRAGEWSLRLLLIGVLAAALWRSRRADPDGPPRRVATSATLDAALRAATRDGRVRALDVRIDSAVPPAQRDWLVALRRAGVTVRWTGGPPALALAAERAREPVAPVRLRLAAARAGPIVLADSLGTIDSVRPARGEGGAWVEARDLVGDVGARAGRYVAAVGVPAAGERRDVLVLGRAGWESRFTLAALAEAGWRVRARLPAAPGAAVADAGLLPIDTARYDVVVALDSTAADLAAPVARFVAAGGGLVAAGTALEIGAWRGMVPARAGARLPGRILLEGDSVTPALLPLRPLVGVSVDAVIAERERGVPSVALRRAGFGRAAALGLDESWRWRMQGGAGGMDAHRAWWSHLVGLVAPERGGSRASATDAAPRAAVVAALGEPAGRLDGAPARAPAGRPLLLLLLAAAALLAETASRRFRGAP